MSALFATSIFLDLSIMGVLWALLINHQKASK